MKRRIKQNVWDNWYGYEGRYRTKEFGLDGAAAGHWLLTGDDTFNAVYASPETLRAAKVAAGLPVPAEIVKPANDCTDELITELESMVTAFKVYAPKTEGAEYNCVISARAAIAKAKASRSTA